MPEGRIIKALSGYYYVLDLSAAAGADPVSCRARGIFKKKGVTPLVGDLVSYESTAEKEGVLTEIKPRSSELVRPPIANVDLAVLVFSIKQPDPNLLLVDKFLVHIEHAGLDAVICFSKHDLTLGSSTGEKLVSDLIALYQSVGYETDASSSVSGIGIQWVRERLSANISVLAGQSGVGKSSLLNALFPEAMLKTGEVSVKLGRGKHTTRHVELLALPNGGFVADTPGFSQLDFMSMEPEALGDCFREFKPFISGCKFRSCLHRNEPKCAVRNAVEAGKIPASRYANYILFVEEIIESKQRRY